MRRILLIILGGLLAGCALTPDYERPDLDMPAQYAEPTSPDPSFANLPWWELFEDPALVSLVEAALAHNKDLGIAVARVDEARAVLGIVRADQFPVVDVQGRGGKFKDSEDVNPLTGGDDIENYDITGFASFELDLWGKLRRATEGARADLLATEAARRNVTISLVALVADTYLSLRDLDQRLAIAERTFASRENSLKIIQARFDKGTVPLLDVAQAEIEAADAQASIASFQREVKRAEYALSVLIGANPGPVTRGADLEHQGLDLAVPAGLPMSLLERRPDVLEAEERLAAETARIGVARAQRLPSLTLTGSYGSQSDEFSNLLDSDTVQWSFFGNLFAPIFNAGQLKSVEQAQRARTEQALLSYEQTVLEALREVDDALVATRTWAAEHEARLRQLTAARKAAELSWARYNGGVVSYLEVLDSERSLFSAELTESRTRKERLSAVVNLYRALGGGWPAAR